MRFITNTPISIRTAATPSQIMPIGVSINVVR